MTEDATAVPLRMYEQRINGVRLFVVMRGSKMVLYTTGAVEAMNTVNRGAWQMRDRDEPKAKKVGHDEAPVASDAYYRHRGR